MVPLIVLLTIVIFIVVDLLLRLFLRCFLLVLRGKLLTTFGYKSGQLDFILYR